MGDITANDPTLTVRRLSGFCLPHLMKWYVAVTLRGGAQDGA